MSNPGSNASGIDVVIVACNSGSLLDDCVARVLDTAECTRLCLVDNASSDGWPERVSSRWSTDPRFKFEPMGRNIGFGAGCNRGAALGTSSWLLFLNPDCLIQADSLARLLAVIEQDPLIGILGADVRDALGGEERAARRLDPSPIRLLSAWLKYFGFNADAVQIAKNTDPVQKVDACSGALLLLPRRLYTQVHGFDEAFFLHGEDLDLCRRVRDQGFKVAVANHVQVIHRQGSSSKARPVFVAWHKHSGLARYLLRYHAQTFWQRALVMIGISIIFLLRGLPQAVFSQAIAAEKRS